MLLAYILSNYAKTHLSPPAAALLVLFVTLESQESADVGSWGISLIDDGGDELGWMEVLGTARDGWGAAHS